MRCLSIVLLCTCLFSCKRSKYDREAIKLNDSAVAITMNGLADRDSSLNAAIVLLNKAIKIDSNYFTGYLNKFIFQNELKRYNDAIITGKQLIRLSSDPKLKVMLEETYKKMKDTTTSKNIRKKVQKTTITNTALIRL